MTHDSYFFDKIRSLVVNKMSKVWRVHFVWNCIDWKLELKISFFSCFLSTGFLSSGFYLISPQESPEFNIDRRRPMKSKRTLNHSKDTLYFLVLSVLETKYGIHLKPVWLSRRTCLFRCFYQNSRFEIDKCWVRKWIQSWRELRGTIIWLGKKSIYWFIRRWKTIWTYTHSKAKVTHIISLEYKYICNININILYIIWVI